MNLIRWFGFGIAALAMSACTTSVQDGEGEPELGPSGQATSGRSGMTGSTGISGRSGITGTTGTIPISGHTGHDGWTGRTGSTGLYTTGATGSTGTTGSSGSWSYCPAYLPFQGDSCDGENMVCQYQNSCSTEDVAVCVDGRWRLSNADCFGACPPYEPTGEMPCSSFGISCSYPNGCGGEAIYQCQPSVYYGAKRVATPYEGAPPSGQSGIRYIPAADPVAPPGSWQVTSSYCASCPPNRPFLGDFCNSPRSCGYANSCGGTDVMTCDGRYWNTTGGSCAQTCPSYVPSYGERCYQEGAACTWYTNCGTPINGSCFAGSWTVYGPACRDDCAAPMPATDGGSLPRCPRVDGGITPTDALIPPTYDLGVEDARSPR